MHSSTFEYLKPTDEQIEKMNYLRQTTAAYSTVLERELPDGADKTFILRSLRSLAMWINVSITRDADGAPRD